MNCGWRNFSKQRVRFRVFGEGIREGSWLNTDLKKEYCFMKCEKKHQQKFKLLYALLQPGKVEYFFFNDVILSKRICVDLTKTPLAVRCARNRLYQLKIELEISLFKNARTIQLFWRITRSKRRRNILVNVRNEIRSKQRMAASTIFKFYRQNEFRLLINELIEKTKTKNISAIKIQCFWRVVISYQQKLLLQNLFNKQNEHKAAIIIQQGLRRMIAMTIVANKRESALKVKILKKENAIVIRRWCRQVLAQIKTERMKEKREKCIRENFELELMASTKIAAFWRGIKGRELKQIKILEKKAQWKKMWSDEDDRYFFYNQVWCFFCRNKSLIRFLLTDYFYGRRLLVRQDGENLKHYLTLILVQFVLIVRSMKVK